MGRNIEKVGVAQRGTRAFVGGYMPIEAKARLVAAAELRGTTVSALLEAMALHAEPIAALLRPAEHGGRGMSRASLPTTAGR